MAKHTIISLPPLPHPAAARLVRAPGSQAAGSPLSVGHGWSCSSSTALHFSPPFLLPPTPKGFYWQQDRILIENLPENFGVLNCAGSYASLLYAHLSDIPSLANSSEKSSSDWQVWKSSPLNTDSGISPAVPGHCQALAPQPGCPGCRDTRGGKALSQTQCSRCHRGKPPQRCHMHSPPHTPLMPTARAWLSPPRTRNMRRCLRASPKLVPAQQEGMGRRALGCPSHVLRVPWGRCSTPVGSCG